MERAAHQQAEAEELAEDGGQGGAAGVHIQDKDEDGVQDDVDHGARKDAHHAEDGVSLKAELVVEDQGGDHEGAADEDVSSVVLGVSGAGGGGAQQIDQRIEPQGAQHTQHRPQSKGGEKGDGGHVLCLLPLLLAQKPGDVVPGALAEGEADGLDDGHQRESHAHGGGGAGTDLAHEEGVGHVVERGDEHTDDGGYRQRGHQSRDGGLGHTGKLVFRLPENGHRWSLPMFSLLFNSIP